MQNLARILAEVFAGLVYLALRNLRMTCIILVAVTFSIVMYGVACKYGLSPVPYPLLFVLVGTIFIVKNWK